MKLHSMAVHFGVDGDWVQITQLCYDASLSGYKPAGDWLEMLPWILRTTLNAEYFPSDTNEMKGNDLWLNVQGNYIYIYIRSV